MRDQNQSTLILRIGKRHADLEGLELVKPVSQTAELLGIVELAMVTGNLEERHQFGLVEQTQQSDVKL